MAVDFDTLTLGPCITAFGEPVTYNPFSDPSFTLNGVFMDGWEHLVVEDGPGVTIDRPMLGARIVDMGSVMPQQNDRVIIRNKEYIVREVRLDAVGHVKLMLNYLNPSI